MLLLLMLGANVLFELCLRNIGFAAFVTDVRVIGDGVSFILIDFLLLYDKCFE